MTYVWNSYVNPEGACQAATFFKCIFTWRVTSIRRARLKLLNVCVTDVNPEGACQGPTFITYILHDTGHTCMLIIDVYLETKPIILLFILFYVSVRVILLRSVLTFSFFFIANLNSFYFAVRMLEEQTIFRKEKAIKYFAHRHHLMEKTEIWHKYFNVNSQSGSDFNCFCFVTRSYLTTISCHVSFVIH